MISSAGILLTVNGGFSERWVRLFSEAGLVGLAHLAWRGAFMLLFLILARGVGAEQISAIGFANVTIVALAGAVGMGAGPFTVRLFAKAGLIDEIRWREDAAALILLVAAATIVASILFVFMLPQDQKMNAWLAPVAGLAVIGTATNAALNGLRSYWVMLINSTLAAAVMLGIAAISIFKGSLQLGLIALAAGFSVKTLADLLYLQHKMTKADWEFNAAAIKRTLIAAFWMGGAGAISSFGVWWLSERMLAMHGDAEFARYLIGFQWYALGAFAVAQLNRVLMPLQVRAATEGRRMNRLLPLLIVGTLASLAFGLVCLLARDLITAAYGDNLGQMGDIIWPFALASASVATANMLGNQLVAEGRERWWLFVLAGWGLVLASLIAAWGSIGLFGFLGALVSANLVMMMIGFLFVFGWKADAKQVPQNG